MHSQISTKFWMCASISLIFFIANVDGKLGAARGKLPEKTADEKDAKVVELISLRYVVPLTASEFLHFVLKSSRSYSTLVLVTNDQGKCEHCETAVGKFQLVANSYYSLKLDPGNELLFVRMSYNDADMISEKLENSSLPSLLYFPTDAHTLNIEKMDYDKYSPISAEAIADWIRELTGVIIRPGEDEDYDYWGKLSTIMLVIFSLFQRRETIRNVLVLESIPIVLMVITIGLISGMLYNHIRGVPLWLHTSSGGISFLHPSSGNQTIIESCIIFISNCSVVYGVIKLIEYRTKNRENEYFVITIIEGLLPIEVNIGLIGITCLFLGAYSLFSIHNFKMSR